MLRATDDNISNLEDIRNWHRNNRLLFDFLFLSTPGAAVNFLLHFKPKRRELANEKAAWDGMDTKHQNGTANVNVKFFRVVLGTVFFYGTRSDGIAK